ncbi:MAG: hypothetical protein HC831_15705 [Chloroflexia bacterium]|nr:hypothetical protein [Chloroflexia bacterium]
MLSINYSKLNNDKFYTLALRIKEISDQYSAEELGIMLYVKNFVDEFIKYKEAMLRIAAGLKIIGEKDAVRDTYSKALRNHVKNYINHPDNELSRLAKALLAEIDKHGKQFYNKTNNEQTAILEYIFKVVEEIYNDFIAETHTDIWYNLLKESQIDFEKTVRKITKEKAEEGNVESASKIRPQLTEAIRNLFTFLPLHFNITKDEQLSKLIAELEEELKKY